MLKFFSNNTENENSDFAKRVLRELEDIRHCLKNYKESTERVETMYIGFEKRLQEVEAFKTVKEDVCRREHSQLHDSLQNLQKESADFKTRVTEKMALSERESSKEVNTVLSSIESRFFDMFQNFTKSIETMEARFDGRVEEMEERIEKLTIAQKAFTGTFFIIVTILTIGGPILVHHWESEQDEQTMTILKDMSKNLEKQNNRLFENGVEIPMSINSNHPFLISKETGS